MDMVIVTVRTVTDTSLEIVMSREYFDKVKDWMFEASGLTCITARKATLQGNQLTYLNLETN
jgi:hypothetical protein